MTGAQTCLWLGGEPAVRLDGVPPAFGARLQRRLGGTRGRCEPEVRVVIGAAPTTSGDDEPGLAIGRSGDQWFPATGLQIRAGAGALWLRERDAGGVDIAATPDADVSVPAGLVQLGLLRRGVLPVHAGLARDGDRLIAAAGWSGGGKTAALLALRRLGFAIEAAEWFHVRSDGGVVAARHRIRVRAAHLRAWRAVGATLPWHRRLAVTALGGSGSAVRAIARATERLPVLRPVAATLGRRVALALEQRAHLDVSVHELRDRPSSTSIDRATPDHDVGASESAAQPAGRLVAVLLLAVGGSRVATRQLTVSELVERMTAALREDLAGVDAAERRLAFATGRRPGWGADWPGYQDLLAERLASAPAWLLTHPRGAAEADLAAAIERTLARESVG